MLKLNTKEPVDGAIVSDLPVPPDFLLESNYVLRVFQCYCHIIGCNHNDGVLI